MKRGSGYPGPKLNGWPLERPGGRCIRLATPATHPPAQTTENGVCVASSVFLPPPGLFQLCFANAPVDERGLGSSASQCQPRSAPNANRGGSRQPSRAPSRVAIMRCLVAYRRGPVRAQRPAAYSRFWGSGTGGSNDHSGGVIVVSAYPFDVDVIACRQGSWRLRGQTIRVAAVAAPDGRHYARNASGSPARGRSCSHQHSSAQTRFPLGSADTPHCLASAATSNNPRPPSSTRSAWRLRTGSLDPSVTAM